MNFKLKNNLVLKTLKTFYVEYYKMLTEFITICFKKYYISSIKKFSNVQIDILSDLICFKSTILNNNGLDLIQEFNPKLYIYIPLKIHNLITNKIKIIYYLIAEFPKYDSYKNIVINGLKKTYISKLIQSNRGIVFNYFIKNNTFVYFARIFINNLTFNIILDSEKIFIIFDNIKYNLISLLNTFGISNKDILLYSRYNNLYFLKKLLLKKESLQLDEYTINNILYKLNSVFNNDLYYLNNLNLNIRLNPKLPKFAQNSLILLDFISIIDILLDLKYNKICLKDLDLLSNKSIQTFGNYLKYNYNKFLSKNSTHLTNELNKFIFFNRDLLNLKTNSNLIVKSKYYFSCKDLITINPLIQYLDQINSISEIMHKNRVINFNSKFQQNLSIRDINCNQLGSLCLLDTTEGINCGLIINFTKYITLWNNQKIQFPYYFLLDKKTKQSIKYINSFKQETFHVIFDNISLRKNTLLHFNYLSLTKNTFKLNYFKSDNTIVIKPSNLFSFSENLIPFLFYNDPARCLMGAKMQSQSVPLCLKKPSLISTGFEKDILNNTSILKVLQEGIVTNVTSYKIIVRDIYNRSVTYYIPKYKKSNQNTVLNQTPIVWPGERVFAGQLLTNSQDILNSEFNIGANLIVSYGNFFGYNFEDALVINKKVIYKQLFTSLHFNIYETSFMFKDNFFEIATWNIPKKSNILKKNLDSFGIIKEGSKVLNNDLLISKILVQTFSNTKNILLLKLFYILFGQNIRLIKDKSILLSFGNSGRVVKVELFTKNIYSNNSTYLKCRVYVCKQRLLSVGDKLCGRHGNKGIVAYIANNSDLPYNKNSITPDIITEALGIPSRMNLGQLFESLFGWVAYNANIRLTTSNLLNYSNLYSKKVLYSYLNKLNYLKGTVEDYNSYIPGAQFLRDGKFGFKLQEPSFLGVARYSKLIHMVKDKIHYRLVGPYTEIMQQPVKGRTNLGGQRFGEMEIWALEAYGASYNLKELLNYKSDDIKARSSLLTDIYNNKLIPSNTTESFKVLIREINGLLLNLEAYSNIDQLDGYNLNLNINY